MKQRKNNLVYSILRNLAPTMDVLNRTVFRFSYRNISYYSRWGEWPWSVKERQLRQAVSRLEKKGWVEVRRQGPKIEVRLTETGFKALKKQRIERISLDKNEPWDNKWSVVIFDVPESRREARDVFRYKLKELGFVQMQRSVWVCPYKCEKQVAALLNFYEIEPFVSLFRGDYMGDDSNLRKIFNL